MELIEPQTPSQLHTLKLWTTLVDMFLSCIGLQGSLIETEAKMEI